jgi:hypothetical protein
MKNIYLVSNQRIIYFVHSSTIVLQSTKNILKPTVFKQTQDNLRFLEIPCIIILTKEDGSICIWRNGQTIIVFYISKASSSKLKSHLTVVFYPLTVCCRAGWNTLLYDLCTVLIKKGYYSSVSRRDLPCILHDYASLFTVSHFLCRTIGLIWPPPYSMIGQSDYCKVC